MSDGKAKKAAEEVKNRAVEELEGDELDEAHGGGLKPIATKFNTVSGRSDVFNTADGGLDKFITFDPLAPPNDSPLKR